MSATTPSAPAAGQAGPPRALGTGEEVGVGELRDAPLRSVPHPSRLDAQIASLQGAGPKLSEAAAAMGIETLGDLLWHLPHGYRDRTVIREVADLRIGEEATVMVTVKSARVRPTRRRGLRLVEASVADASGPLKAVWFNQAWLAEKLKPGSAVLLHGRNDRSGFRVEAHEMAGAGGEVSGLHTIGIVPVHPASERLKPARVREWAHQVLALAGNAIEPLPAEVRARHGLASAADALSAAHFPARLEDADAARRRLAFEELFLHQAALAARRGRRIADRPGIELAAGDGLARRWLASLPFEPTAGQREAFAEIDRDLASGQAMQRLLMGEVGSGKAQPLDSLVLTPSGFRRMGEIEVGDRVVTPDGANVPVSGVFPQGIREVWRVRFSDGSTVKCDLDHLWAVRTSAARFLDRSAKIKTLREIRDDLTQPNGASKWHVELPEPVGLEGGGERPVDPYLLGLLLGDGGLSVPGRVTFTSADEELVEELRRRLPPGCSLRRKHARPYDWVVRRDPPDCDAELQRVRRGNVKSYVAAYLAGATSAAIGMQAGVSEGIVRRRLIASGIARRSAHRPGPLLVRQLSALGMIGKTSHFKRVPTEYLNAPIEVRHAVLQGLLDTDGTLSRRQGSNVSFGSASEGLAEDVAWLARSLGGRARVRVRTGKVNLSWRTSIQLPQRFSPFRLARKASLLSPRTKYANPAKAIESVERVGREEVQCIAVDHPDRLYVTDGFTVTHNTVCAVHGMLRAVEAGYQAALMAPTETLAEQHAATLATLLAAESIPFTLLTGSATAARRRRALGRLASGELSLIVGTHALIEDDVSFARLGLCVVDEQHRFGVRQRAALDAKGPGNAAPHVLHMTATPIPRTLSLTAYGDLDTTTLRELPAGRQPVKTFLVGEERRPGAYEFIRERLREGRQAYVVCPLVEGSEKLEGRAAAEEFERLRSGELADFDVELLHGQMKSAERSAAMEAFASGAAQVLVATTVIEVGIDVPNATVMLVEGAERFGLSQLHQLRGRIGRGEHPSQCILFADAASELAQKRLEAIASLTDGFELAEVDLTLRGEGEILGTRQSGLPAFRAAVLPADHELLALARRELLGLLRRHGSLDAPGLGPLLDAARARYGDERAEAIAA